jgi:hypothetical protein
MVDFAAVLIAGDAAEIAKAKSRIAQILPMFVGFIAGCAVGAASQAVCGMGSLALPTSLALLASEIGCRSHRQD